MPKALAAFAFGLCLVATAPVLADPLGPTARAGQQTTLKDAVLQFATAHNIALVGLDHIGQNEPAKDVAGQPESDMLHALLQDYAYVAVQSRPASGKSSAFPVRVVIFAHNGAGRAAAAMPAAAPAPEPATITPVHAAAAAAPPSVLTSLLTNVAMQTAPTKIAAAAGASQLPTVAELPTYGNAAMAPPADDTASSAAPTQQAPPDSPSQMAVLTRATLSQVKGLAVALQRVSH